ncbi:MAG TPA: glycosyltransferase family 2 protein [Gemmatimonadaceae bacterium]|jgi:glycosyltransferase involved in cell wall biosynthesis|nr:glycosyltransferase family 2 protein [Gemmatimonadaceae bacterium]
MTGSASEKDGNNSLIIATYNWKEALALVLATIRAQSVLPGEVLIADDGSRDDTRELVVREAETFPVPLRHFWQEDDGFRKSRIVNEAMARATGEYLIEIDGDMMLHPEFVRSHLRAARRGWYIQGSRMMLGEAATARTLATRALAAGPLSPGVRNRINGIHAPFLSRFSRGEQGPIHRTRGCNISYWREDILRVNGYNEDMEGWGREDTELVARLMNSGVRRRNLKFAAVSYHLHHGAREKDADAANLALALQVARDGITRCAHGIDRHLAAE